MPETAIEAGGTPAHRPPAALLARFGDGNGFEPGSFRDRSARVFYRDGSVCRGLGEKAYADWLRLRQSAFFARLSEAGLLVGTEETNRTLADSGDAWAAVLRHDKIPFVSYPYEWCFDMLRDAALLHLDLLLAALEENFILKDATPFNVQWKGARPVFIDVTSFEPLADGESWVAYRQFCQLFLYPLLLQAYKGVPFQPWLRGRIDGIGPEDCWRLMSLRDLLRPGVLTHVYLHARAQENLGASSRAVRRELRDAGFGKETIEANVRRLRPLVAGLSPQPEQTAWSHYGDNSGYAEEAGREKASFVEQVARARDWELVWDLGSNTGTFARLAARHARYVVAMDADRVAVDRLYQALREEKVANILPLVVDIADPSPSLGWRGLERKSIPERGRPSLTLCLAVLHHLVIGANVPLPELVAWLAGLGGDLVVEFVTREDARVKQLLRNRVDQFSDYDLGIFEHCLAQHFEVVRRQPLPSGTRVLYHAHPRSAS
jgi:ribosomal protein L11 methylase PrmA